MGVSQVNRVPVSGFDYEVSDSGLVYSMPRVVVRGNGRPYTCREKQLKPWYNGSHLQVELHRGDQKTYRYVHILVLEGFVGARPPGGRGLHRDDNPWNNNVSNLYWGTMQDNALDRVRNGRDHNANKVECKRGHPLTGSNLAPWSRPKKRICWACNRANTLANSHGRARDEPYVTMLAERYYSKLGGDAP